MSELRAFSIDPKTGTALAPSNLNGHARTPSALLLTQMLDQEHPSIYVPKGNPRIWRYMDFSRLLAIFENRKLIVPRTDQFDDPYEGLYSQKVIDGMDEHDRQLPEKPTVGFADQIIAISAKTRREMFATCWCAMDCESAALWKLYLQSREGVAIMSDYSALSYTLGQSKYKARISMVGYVDYDRETVPFGNMIAPFVHKRNSFAHEHEMRGLIWSLESDNKGIPEDSTSLSVDVDPEALIKAVYISPVAPSWFADLVEQMVKRYGLKLPVVRSTLYARPAYLDRA